MTQRVIFEGEEWEMMPQSRLPDKDHNYCRFLFRKVEKPAPKEKESERCWKVYSEHTESLVGTLTVAEVNYRAKRLTDFILARVREELPEMLKAREI